MNEMKTCLMSYNMGGSFIFVFSYDIGIYG